MDFQEATPALPQREAEAAWEQWKGAHRELFLRLDPRDVRKDIICTSEYKTLIRYLVRVKQ